MSAEDRESFCPSSFAAEVFPIARKAIERLRLPREEADDLLQEVCLVVLSCARRRGSAVFQSRSKLSTWVHSVVGNAARMRMRSKQRHVIRWNFVPVDEDALPDEAPSVEAAIDHGRALERLERAMEVLSIEQREILRRAAAGASTEDIARDLGVGVQSVRSKLFRMRRKIARAAERIDEPA